MSASYLNITTYIYYLLTYLAFLCFLLVGSICGFAVFFIHFALLSAQTILPLRFSNSITHNCCVYYFICCFIRSQPSTYPIKQHSHDYSANIFFEIDTMLTADAAQVNTSLTRNIYALRIIWCFISDAVCLPKYCCPKLFCRQYL